MKVDYILVGFGLAGMAFAHHLRNRNKSFVVFDNNQGSPNRIIGGMYNPVILKRFTPAWQTHRMLQTALPFYKELEQLFHKKYIYPANIYRVLHAPEEQNNWAVASDKKILSHYMIPKIAQTPIKGIKADFGFGVLQHVGRVEGEQIVADYTGMLLEQKLFIHDSFDYNAVSFSDSYVKYKEIQATNIVFAEGSFLPQNPFFNYLPMKAAKGEMLVIEVPDLTTEFIIKSGVFMVPLGANTYVVGATYNWNDTTFKHTAGAQEELQTKLQKFLTLPYKIIDYKVGIRPTIKDRRPLIGVHPEYDNLFVLNGLGTRGIILAPSLANHLLQYIEDKDPLPEEMDISRFYKKYYN